LALICCEKAALEKRVSTGVLKS